MASDGSVEGCLIAGSRRVFSISSPFPDKLVWLNGQGGVRDTLPCRQVLTNLLQPHDAADVSSPGIAGEAFRHRPRPSPVLGDA